MSGKDRRQRNGRLGRSGECGVGSGGRTCADRHKSIWRISLDPDRGERVIPSRPRSPPWQCFGPLPERQVSMYLAKHVGAWSLSKIGHRTTVLHAIAKIEQLRKPDEALDALMDVLTATLLRW